MSEASATIASASERREGQMLREFKEFVLRGNLLELAVAFVLGLAFAAVINAFIAGIILPFIAAIVGKPNFDALTFTVGDGVIRYGTFLTALINFLLIALVLFSSSGPTTGCAVPMRYPRERARTASPTSRRLRLAARPARPSWRPHRHNRFATRKRAAHLLPAGIHG
jgi:large-conductance mechanosensitive channel